MRMDQGRYQLFTFLRNRRIAATLARLFYAADDFQDRTT